MKENRYSERVNVLFRQLDKLSGALYSRRMNAVWFVNKERAGYIRLWNDENIVEMDIRDSQGKSLFWTHFPGDDALVFYDHIHAFFQVLYETSEISQIREDLKMEPLKLLIVCTAGMTSSVVAQRINELSQKNDYLIEADSACTSEADTMINDYDVVLCAPQAAEWFSIRKDLRHSGMISPYDFGTFNVDGIISQARRLAM